MPGIFNNRLKLGHIHFSIIYTLVVYVAFNVLTINKVVQWFNTDQGTDYAGLFAYLVFGYSFFLSSFLLFAHRKIIKLVASLLVIFSAAATYFIDKYDIAVDRSMIMNTLYTDSTEVTGLLSVYMLPYVLLLIVVPLFLIYKVDIQFNKSWRYLPVSLAVLVLSLVIGIGSVYSNYNSIHQAGNISHKSIIYQLVPVNVISGLGSAAINSYQDWYEKNKNPIVITGKVDKPDNLIVVLAIGESSRQKNFSLYGYKRKDTNPILSGIDGLIMLNGKAEIGSTLLALPEILEKNDIKLPAITSKLGINTACYVNYTLYDNCAEVGEVRVSNCAHDGKCYDEDVLPLLEKNLGNYQSGYGFVVLHLGGGSHGPTYRDRFPPEFQRFKPQCEDADVVNKCTREELYNTYDNTILYVDYVLGEIIGRLDKSGLPYVFIYVSDHGESLLEDGRIFHGMPPGMSLPPEQAQVPLIIKSSVPIRIDEQDEYPQNDIFDSVLELFTIQSDQVDSERSFIHRQEAG